MPNVTFTIDDTIAGVGPKKLSFLPRTAYATPAGAIVPATGPKPIRDKSYARGVEHTEALPEGPWWVAGLLDDYIPIDVGPSGGNLNALIAWEVPQDAPTTTLAQGIAAWAQAHGVDIIAEEAGLLTQEAADAAYAPASVVQKVDPTGTSTPATFAVRLDENGDVDALILNGVEL